MVHAMSNTTVHLPGTVVRTVTCDKYTRDSNPQQWLCAVTHAGADPGGDLIPILHNLGSDKLLFDSFEALDPEKYPPSSSVFQPPSTCSSTAPTQHNTAQWQVILGSTVGAFVAGIILAITTVRCRSSKQQKSDKHAYQTALLDVM